MGQSPESKTTRHNLHIQSSLRYAVEIHLIEPNHTLPSSFASPIQRLINELEHLANQIEESPIEKYLISSLQQRFSKIDGINEQAFHSGKNYVLTSQKDIRFSELQTKQQFLKLINKLQSIYLIEVKLSQQFEKQSNLLGRGESASMDTLRKPIWLQGGQGQDIDQSLVIRLVFYYYLKMFKLNIYNHSQIINKFHTDTGRMLCMLVYNHYMNVQKLFQIFYHLVCIDKQGEQTLKQTLIKLHHQYHPICLKYSHSINLPQAKMQILQTATRIYLDELYYKSLQEAEDPQIKYNDDSLMPIKVFPISRVKDKQK